MARQYVEKQQKVYAVQNTGDLKELQDFAPGQVTMEDGKIMLTTTSTPPVVTEVRLTDWLMDDPIIGFITAVTHASFDARFNIQ